MTLEDIQKLLDAATMAPYQSLVNKDGVVFVGPVDRQDARLIAACPQLIQALLDVARAAQKLTDQFDIHVGWRGGLVGQPMKEYAKHDITQPVRDALSRLEQTHLTGVPTTSGVELK